MLPQFFYLQVECNSAQSELSLRRLVEEACKTLFGEVGGSIPVDVLSVQDKTAVLRVNSTEFRKVWAALTVTTQLRVHKVSPSLQALV